LAAVRLSVDNPIPGGFYGKLPSHGDFVTRGLPEEFRNVWDHWLQGCIARSQEVLGSDWLDRYLVSPVWRFVLSPGTAGRRAYTGILFPSVDRVGRYFPMTAAIEISPDTINSSIFESVDPWLESAESIMLGALDREENDLDEIASMLAGYSDVQGDSNQVRHRASPLTDLPSVSHWRVGVGKDGAPGTALSRVLFDGLAASVAPLTLWWSGGAPGINGSLLVARRLPDSEAFAEMIDGFRTARVWQGDLDSETREEGVGRVGVTIFRSSTSTTPGKVRANNEDSFCDRTSEGLWAVADGMGGHSHGEVASRMVTDALGCLSLSGNLEARVEQVRQSLLDVNAELRHLSASRTDGFNAGSTVVVFVSCSGRAAAVWAGDSRAYRLRGEALEVLTSDHVEESDVGARSHVVTRAVGGADLLEPECRYLNLSPGDRIFLCSDGVHGELSTEEIESSLSGKWSERLAPEILDQVLDRLARDNATAVVIDCESGE